MSHITLLKNCRGEVISVYESRAKAEEKASKYNADPLIEPGTADADAPYSAETWAVTR